MYNTDAAAQYGYVPWRACSARRYRPWAAITVSQYLPGDAPGVHPPGRRAPGLRIVTHNVSGLQNSLKVISLLRFYTLHNIHIVCWQETKTNTSRGAEQSDVEYWISQASKQGAAQYSVFWANNTIHNIQQGVTECGGTAVLIKTALITSGQVIVRANAVSAMPDGRVGLCKLSWAGHSIALANTYWPNETARQRAFVQSLQSHTAAVQAGSLWVVGDFNHTASPEQDRMVTREIATLRYGSDKITHQRFMSAVGQTHHLQDAFRYKHPQSRGFTRIAHQAPSRIDRMYVPETVIPWMEQCQVVPCPLSDHQPVLMHLRPITPLQPAGRQLKSIKLRFLNNPDVKSSVEMWVGTQWEQAQGMESEHIYSGSRVSSNDINNNLYGRMIWHSNVL